MPTTIGTKINKSKSLSTHKSTGKIPELESPFAPVTEGEAIASGNPPHGYVCTSERNVPIPRFIKDNSPRTKHDGSQAITIVRTHTTSGILCPETLVR